MSLIEELMVEEVPGVVEAQEGDCLGRLDIYPVQPYGCGYLSRVLELAGVTKGLSLSGLS